MMLVMWFAFGGDLETALIFAVISVFGIIYLGLLFGGILLSDVPPTGEAVRSFRAFINGRVAIDGGITNGRDALVQIVGLPVTIVITAIILSVIARTA